MPNLPLITDDFHAFVRALVLRYEPEDISEATNIPVEDINRWYRGENHYYPQAENRLYGFCINHQAFDLIEPHLPSFDKREAFDFESAPLGDDIQPPQVELINRPTRIAGYAVNFPFGISASVLTRNSKAIAFYAARGFDILTYKTVRSVKRIAHDPPNWAFVLPESVEKFSPPFEHPVIGDRDYWPDDPQQATMANSFGIPSMEPDLWQPDVEAAKRSLHKGQILIVSVVASPSMQGWSEKALTEDFVRVALQAKEAGADIVEANYSCPNTQGDPSGLLYKDPEMSGRVSREVSRTLGTTPLFVKIGYLPQDQLTDFVSHNQRHIRGIVAINTISAPVESPGGTQLFPDSGPIQRRYAGVSGAAIRPLAIEVVRDLVDIRKREKAIDEFDIIAVGGVGLPQHVFDYLDIGANAVEACTAAYLNPYIAVDTRLQLLKRKTEQEAGKIEKGPTQEGLVTKKPTVAELVKRIVNGRDPLDELQAAVHLVERSKELREKVEDK